jgi:hypothetical protein
MNNADLKGILIYKKDKTELEKAKREIESLISNEISMMSENLG